MSQPKMTFLKGLMVTLSPNGELVASGDASIHLTLRDAETGDVVKHWLVQSRMASYRSMTPYVWAMSFSPEGGRLAVALEGGTMEVFNIGTGKLMLEKWDVLSGESFVEHTHAILGIAISPYGAMLPSVSTDETIRFWDVESGQQMGESLQQSGPLFSRQMAITSPPEAVKARFTHLTNHLPAMVQPVQTHRSPDDLDILDLPATSRPPVSGLSGPPRANAAASHLASKPAGLHGSWESLGESFQVDATWGIAPARHAAAEETPRRSQLPEKKKMPSTPGYYGSYTILPAAPPTDTRSPNDNPNEVTPGTTLPAAPPTDTRSLNDDPNEVTPGTTLPVAPPTDTRSPNDDPNEVTPETTGHAVFCGLWSKLPFRRSKHPNNSGARNSVV
ncbi:quinon protein alcohol dehydrogenase-like superfamily [Melanogaster broomeanus]|nr:quinon protein alcohol dehydrogenase-like superfamily [Melanogaster broomeanus]